MKSGTIEFEGWKKCVELKNGGFRIVVTTEVGPRIIGAFLGQGPNMLYVAPETAGKKGGDEWNIYGGHRLWHSPEARPRSYTPDNTPVSVKKEKDGFVFSSGIEQITGINKSVKISPAGKNGFKLTHILKNENLWNIELAAWALTVMAQGGTAVVPQPQGDKETLLPNRYLTIWPYTNMADPRFTWGDKYILTTQDVNAKSNAKFGINCENGWIAYVNKGYALKKSFSHFVDAEYPDNGCSVEIFSCPWMLEIETLSPLYQIAPGDTIFHEEVWEAFKCDDVSNEKTWRGDICWL
jgi:hypothetical protein